MVAGQTTVLGKMLLHLFPADAVVGMKKAMNRMRHVTDLHQVAVEFRSRVVPNPAFHELTKAHLVSWLIIRQPQRHIFTVFFQILVHRDLLKMVHRIGNVIAFVLGFVVLDPFTVKHLLLIKQYRQLVYVHRIDKSIVS